MNRDVLKVWIQLLIIVDIPLKICIIISMADNQYLAQFCLTENQHLANTNAAHLQCTIKFMYIDQSMVDR